MNGVITGVSVIMNSQQFFAGIVAGWLLSILYGVRYTDMCPFRAIRREALDRLEHFK